MEKNVIIRAILGIVAVLVLTVGMFAVVKMLMRNQEGGDSGKLGKTLVVYYSAQNHTEVVARKIAKQLDAEVFEIRPKNEYSAEDLIWTKGDSRVAREYDDENLREVELVETEVKDWEKYDTVLIGYPIWWGIAAWPTNAFVKEQDFSGKTVIPFCTSSSSELGNSAVLLKQDAEGGSWQTGHRFASEATDEEITEWVKSIR